MKRQTCCVCLKTTTDYLSVSPGPHKRFHMCRNAAACTPEELRRTNYETYFRTLEKNDV
jgi:hypothetical protein